MNTDFVMSIIKKINAISDEAADAASLKAAKNALAEILELSNNILLDTNFSREKFLEF
jgi:hypothetical protein